MELIRFYSGTNIRLKDRASQLGWAEGLKSDAAVGPKGDRIECQTMPFVTRHTNK
jgi:hypothetical protein